MAYGESWKTKFSELLFKRRLLRERKLGVQFNMSSQIISGDLKVAILDKIDYLSNIGGASAHDKLASNYINSTVESATFAAH
jgi:hypothetical protein